MRTKNPQRVEGRAGRRQNLPQVVDADRAVDVEAKLRQLERQVALGASAIDGVDELQILARGGVGRRERRDAFAKIVERAEEPLRLYVANRRDRIVDGFAGDEAPGERAGSRHPVSGRERLQCSAVGERLEEGFGRNIQHQWVRAEPDVSRCSIARA